VLSRKHQNLENRLKHSRALVSLSAMKWGRGPG
jgi:hypothetical protein